MCGIVGFVGQGKIQEHLLTGLGRLEYRGYDSAGIYTVDSTGHGELYKTKGRIKDLEAIVKDHVGAVAGIGHTRWATHGPATTDNAHPHVSASERFVLVHNGVIENYAELKENCLKDVTFKSNTDTEVIVQLMDYMVKQAEDKSTEEIFRQVLSLIRGSYALALIDRTQPDVLYVAKNKSPLLVGMGQGFNVICSDAMATIDLSQENLAIKDQEIVIVSADDITIKNLQGEVVERSSFYADIDVQDIEKGPYPFHMLKEIDEQAGVIRHLIQTYYPDQTVRIDSEILADLKAADQVYIVACGTSYNAGLVGRSFFEDWLGVPCQVYLASEFAYHPPLKSQHPFFIFLSQSGETADSRQALLQVNEWNAPSLTITNVKGSTLSREAKHTLLLHAGPEIAVASTKAYTAQIAMLAILCDALAEDKHLNIAASLSKVANDIEIILANKSEIERIVKDTLLATEHVFYIGRQLDYAVALEAALKLKEISYIHTEAFAAGELKHGTIALIEKGVPVIAIITEAKTAAHTRGNIEEVKARGAEVIVIADEANQQAGDQLILPTSSDLLSPLTSVVYGQLLAYYTALAKDLDVDKPRNLAKSVTVE